MKAFCSWSGGKDSSLALFIAKTEGIDCIFLLNMIEEDGKYTRSHGVPKEMIKSQAANIGIELLQIPTSWENYENEFKKAILYMKRFGIEAGIFGDIDIEEHRLWVERVCKELRIVPLLPLWKMEREIVIRMFLKEGFKAFLCSTKHAELVRHIGKDIDEELLVNLCEMSMDPCGENGEFHTFVYDGPLFKSPLKIIKKGVLRKQDFYFLDFALKE